MPTDEDSEWFPDLAGSDWRESLDFAMRNFKDESFIAQYLSPKMIRDFRLFTIIDDDSRDKLRVDAIHNEQGYQTVRTKLSDQYNLGSRDPNIQVWSVDLQGDRSLTLRHFQHQRRPLGDNRKEMLRHVGNLWGFPVKLEEQDAAGEVCFIDQIQVDRRRPRQ